MPCDTRLRSGQSIGQRKDEVKSLVAQLDKLLMRRKVRVRVGPQGAVAFEGWDDDARGGVTDACAYRRLMVSGSALAKMEIARAEQLAGRSVDRRVVGQGVHSHDGGRSWHEKG